MSNLSKLCYNNRVKVSSEINHLFCDSKLCPAPLGKIASAKYCAALYQATRVEACPYHPPSMKCIVSKPDGENLTGSNVTYIAKVEIEDPFVEPDPFAETDTEAKEACLVHETALKSELSECKAASAASSSGSSHSSCA
ncbi:hypothetical protein FGLOB1_147 [Fusarium globosum]|uniref:Uncharacterized protein n=1 Tax=Fusarium globosum TaxID=78864 RepID=A0A8H6DL56_9HYPO|nr:hypothetical protein FGLOB1_147 [Fusarium globosum]